jgi:hypothetical protein
MLVHNILKHYVQDIFKILRSIFVRKAHFYSSFLQKKALFWVYIAYGTDKQPLFIN